MITAKAKLYSSGEGSDIKPFLNDLSKNDFLGLFDTYEKVPNWEYSKPLSNFIEGVVLLIGEYKVASIWFDDGTVFDVKQDTWRPGYESENNARFIKELYQVKLATVEIKN